MRRHARSPSGASPSRSSAAVVWQLAQRLARGRAPAGRAALAAPPARGRRGELERGLAVTRMHLADVAARRAAAARRHPARLGRTAASSRRRRSCSAAAARPLRARRAHRRPSSTPGTSRGAHSIPLDELEDRLRRAAAARRALLVTCAAGGRSTAGVRGPRGARLDAPDESRRRHARLDRPARAREAARPAAARRPPGPRAPRSRYPRRRDQEAQVVEAIRECYDPEIPINVYDLGLIYGIDIDPRADRDPHDAHLGGLPVGAPDPRGRQAPGRRRSASPTSPSTSSSIRPGIPRASAQEGKTKLGL